MTKQQQATKDAAIAKLREWIKPGDTVHTVLRHVSRSGMQREVGVVLIGKDGDTRHPNFAVADAIGARVNKRGDGIVIGGCGLDVGFEIVYLLGLALFPGRTCAKCGQRIPADYPTDVTSGCCDAEIVGGFWCLGKDCPSNDHANGDRNRERHLHSSGGYALSHRWL